MSVLMSTGLALLAAAALWDMLVPGAARRRTAPAAVPYLLCASGSGLLAGIGGAALRSADPPRLGFGNWLAFGTTHLTLDRLSALFWLLTFSVACTACLAAAGWVPGRLPHRGAAAAGALLLASVAVVESADNAFLFVFAWEALTGSFYLLAGTSRREDTARAAFLTFAAGKVSGAALLIGLLLATGRTGSFSFSSFTHLPTGGVHDTVWTLLVIAFAIKIGLLPVQVWLPRGYAAAPPGLRALMAGVAVNAGFYGLWRTLALFGAPPSWLGVTLLLVGAVTALLGVAHAAVQGRLERVIAYSSVENAGLICTGYAVALIGAAHHQPRLTAVGLLAATLQVIAHALAKTLVFVSVAAVESSVGTGDLEQLRGAARHLPWAGTGLAVGSLTLAGLPPTAGFVSEWFLLESLMQQFRLPHLPYALCLAGAGALIALTVGFASVTFTRIIGMVVLGPTPHPRKRRARCTEDLGTLGRCGAAVLAAGCLALAALAPLETRILTAGLGGLVPGAPIHGALDSPWVLQPVYADFSSLSPSWLWVAMPILFLGATFVLLVAVSGRRAYHVRRVPAWRSASGEVEGTDQYTPFAFANPTRRVLSAVLLTRTRTSLSELEQEPESVAQANETKPAAAPGPRPAVTGGILGYSSDVMEAVETYLYRPLLRPAQRLVTQVRRLQSGRLDAYLTYMLITLVALLALVAGLA
ncbi:proton-conducting transporter membrane subunit [Streptomyces sp. NPDC047046]|uniref:proton-conducting transporter transmembrane domain-containing protein n=1 Tax=Streptomyces sp. NPDC047046 TaxID=3155378 RepID=UPI0033F4A4F8